MRRLLTYILFISIVTAITSCNNTDNLSAIFTDNPKKMTMIFEKNGTNRIPITAKWGEEGIECLETAKKDENYILTYTGVEEDGTIAGRFEFKLVKITLKGKWGADGKKNTMWVEYDHPAMDPSKGTDRLEKEIIRTFVNIKKYSGDKNSQSLYYKEGNSTSKHYIGFVTF